MTDFLPPGADAGSEPRPDVPPPDEVMAGSRPDAVSAAATGSEPLRDDSWAGEPGAEAPGDVPTEPNPGKTGAVPTEPVIPTPTGPRPPRRMPVVALGYLAAAVVGALLLGGSLVAVGGVGRAAPSPSPTPAPPPNVANGPSLGTSAAPVTIEIWADYQCPFCRLEAMVFGGSMERAYVLPGTARIVYHDFAFLGQESIDAAVAARCAGRQDPGAYWRYHDLLFASQQGENQGAFSRANLVTLAGIASLDATAFTACLDDPAVAKAVADETAQGRALGIASTPTLRITGPAGTRMLTGFSQSWAAIRDAVAAVESAPASASPGTGGSHAPASSGVPAATP
jgi:protein-disulfide isomerase